MTFHGTGFDLTGGSQTLQSLQSLQNIQGNMLLKSYYLGGGAPGQLILPGYPTSTQPMSLPGGGGVAVNSVPDMMSHLPYSPRASTVTSPKEKKFRPPARSALKSQRYIPKPIPVELGNLKTYSNPDFLICGNCKELFSDLMDMLDHKKNYCKMRFLCKCESSSDFGPSNSCDNSLVTQSGHEDHLQEMNRGKRVCLRCTHCKETFIGAWDLMFHVQNAHSITIYTLGERKKNLTAESGEKDSNCSSINSDISTTPSDFQQTSKITNSLSTPICTKSHKNQTLINSHQASVVSNSHQTTAFNKCHGNFQQKPTFTKHQNSSQNIPTISAPPVLLNM